MAKKSVPVNVAGACCEPLRASEIDDADAVSLAAAFAALADPARLRLLSLISTSPTGEACACDLIEPIGKSQPTVSHHLKILVESGLIEREKRGIWMWYRTNQARVDALRTALS
jgi:ArsR family transcriptional regulator, arsenate/arsenite/antimonite-responsive transcriptional repressor